MIYYDDAAFLCVHVLESFELKSNAQEFTDLKDTPGGDSKCDVTEKKEDDRSWQDINDLWEIEFVHTWEIELIMWASHWLPPTLLIYTHHPPSSVHQH